MLFIEVLELHNERVTEILNSCEAYHTVAIKQFVAGDKVAIFTIGIDIVNELDIPDVVWRMCKTAGYPLRIINTTAEDDYCMFLRYSEVDDPLSRKITHNGFHQAKAISNSPKSIFHSEPDKTRNWLLAHTFWVKQECYYKEHSFNKLVRLV